MLFPRTCYHWISLILESWSSKVLVSREYDAICTVGWMVLKFTGNFHLQAFTGTGAFGHDFRVQTCPRKVYIGSTGDVTTGIEFCDTPKSWLTFRLNLKHKTWFGSIFKDVMPPNKNLQKKSKIRENSKRWAPVRWMGWQMDLKNMGNMAPWALECFFEDRWMMSIESWGDWIQIFLVNPIIWK